MSISRRINTLIFPLLLFTSIALLAWLSTQKIWLTDLTSNQRQSLSQPSQLLLQKANGPIDIDVFINRADQLGQQVAKLLNRYQQIKPDLTVNYISPEENPDKIREYNIRLPAEMLIRYKGKMEHLKKPSEQTISNAIASLLRDQKRWLVFLQGHGERDPLGKANFDYSKLSLQLKARGLNSQSLNLQSSSLIPDNTAVLIIADPKVDFLASEWALIEKYLDAGGNLLWLNEPDHTQLFPQLANKLGIDFLPGTVVDAAGQQFNITQPDLIPVVKYPAHAITENFTLTTLFPQVSALKIRPSEDWDTFPLLLSSKQSWTERSSIKDQVEYNEGKEVLGPLTIGVTFNSKHQQQRIVLIGDSDFISNSYIGNGGNLDLGIRIFNWLSADDQLIAIPARPATDLDFELSKNQSMIIGLAFLVVMPLLFILIGLIIWWRRKAL